MLVASFKTPGVTASVTAPPDWPSVDPEESVSHGSIARARAEPVHGIDDLVWFLLFDELLESLFFDTRDSPEDCQSGLGVVRVSPSRHFQETIDRLLTKLFQKRRITPCR